jgi:hypothetical protein
MVCVMCLSMVQGLSQQWRGGWLVGGGEPIAILAGDAFEDMS